MDEILCSWAFRHLQREIVGCQCNMEHEGVYVFKRKIKFVCSSVAPPATPGNSNHQLFTTHFYIGTAAVAVAYVALAAHSFRLSRAPEKG